MVATSLALYPVADAGLDTTRIALQRRATQLEYYARSGWVDRAPLMICEFGTASLPAMCQSTRQAISAVLWVGTQP